MIVNCIQTAKIKTSINNLSDMCSNLYDQGNEYNFTLVFKCGVCVIISSNIWRHRLCVFKDPRDPKRAMGAKMTHLQLTKTKVLRSVRKIDPRPIYFGFWCLMINTTKLGRTSFVVHVKSANKLQTLILQKLSCQPQEC